MVEAREFDEESVDLREYLTILKRRKWSVITATVLAVGLAIGVSYLQTPLYSAEARVLIAPSITSPESGSVPQAVPVPETESQVVASEPVAEIVRAELQLDDPSHELLEDLEVSSIVESQVLEVRYTATDPDNAQQIVNAFAQGYITFRREQAVEAITAAQEASQQQIDESSSELAEISARLESAEQNQDESLVATLESQRNSLLARLGVLQQRLDDLDPSSSLQFTGAQLIESAQRPEAPSSPNYVMNAALGLVLGLILGIGIALLRERLDDRFRDRVDIEKGIRAPVLATVPQFGTRKTRKGDLITMIEPTNVASETYRGLRTNLQFITSQRGIKSVMLTSASAAEGKTVTTANLGVALAQAGRRVILVSSDLRRPTLEGYFGVEGREEGLSSWLAEPDAEPWSLLKDPGIMNLRVLPCGPIPGQPAELLSTPQLAQLIGMLEANADLVVFDSPPVLAVADATILASRVGGIVLVIDATSTARSAATTAAEHLVRAGGSIVGSVSNLFDPDLGPGYYYSDYDYSAEKSDGRGSTSQGNGNARSFWRRRRPSRSDA